MNAQLQPVTLSESAEARMQFWSAPDDALFPACVVAHVLDVTPKTLINWRAADSGPKSRRRGHAHYYRKADVAAWMAGEKVAA